MQERSTQYNWFKGAKGQEEEKSFKDRAKVVWKFTKIFIYITLFVFTMFGCIQLFTHKMDNIAGRGVEIYAEEADVAPHVSVFDIGKSQVGNTDSNAHDIYTVEYNAISNVWVNEEKDLKAIHDEVKVQNKTNDLKLQDALNGVNESFNFHYTYEGAPASTKDNKVVLSDTNKPLVGSSEMTQYTSVFANPVNSVDVYVLDKGNEFRKMSFDLTTKSAKEGFRADIIRSFFSAEPFKSFFAKDPSASSLNFLDSVDGKTSALDYAHKYQEAYTKALSNVFAYAAVHPVYAKDSHGKDTQEITKFAFTASGKQSIPGFTLPSASNASYKPMVTWKDAWVNGVGPFYGLFVYPTGLLTSKLIKAIPFLKGWETFFSIAFVVFLIRAITFALSFKSTMQQTMMQEMQAKKAIIDAKYASYKGNKQMENRQKAEVADLYKKQGINPLSSLGSVLLTMPFFLAIWRTIGAIPHIKATVWLGMHLSLTSYKELFSGHFQYLPLMILAAFFAAFQQIFPRLLTKRRDKNRINVHQRQAMKKNNKMQNIMVIVFVAMSQMFSAGLQVYWIIGGVWMIFQSYMTHYLFIRQSKNKKRKQVKA